MKSGMALGILALTWLMLPAAAAAQDVATSLDELLRARELGPGDGVYVTDAAGRRIKGTISDASASMLRVTDGRDAWTFDEREVTQIELQDPVGSGIWIGIGIAVASTLTLCGLEDSGNGACYLALYSFWPALGAGAGLGWYLDATNHKTILKRSGATRLSVSPVVSTERLGAAASISW